MEAASRHFFPLTSLQIGDMQSYISRLTIFLVPGNKRFFILLDNRPWLIGQDTKAAHLWQLMVTKSRISPFANNRARKRNSSRGRKLNFTDNSIPTPTANKKSSRWSSVIDEAMRQTNTLKRVKTLKDPYLLNKALHSTLFGFIVFEVEWAHVRGINYVNELQSDTSVALEAKSMKRWEFDSIEQAVVSMGSWFLGNFIERQLLQDFLESMTCSKGDEFYDAQECSSTVDRNENVHSCTMMADSSRAGRTFFQEEASVSDSTDSIEKVPPSTGPYKRRKILKSNSDGKSLEESYAETLPSPSSTRFSRCLSTSESEQVRNPIEVNTYRDVLVLFRFNDLELPYKLKEIIVYDLRLLTLLEYGLPSWVIFLQSYPIFCKVYRPWMCPLARFLYVIMSIVTVLIGFYDLYKNVPLLKATASRLLGPLFHWIETWEMISRLKYLGTMLVLHNFEEAVRWFLKIINAFKSVLSILTKPFVSPILEALEFLLPLWNICADTIEYLSSAIWIVVESSFGFIMTILEILIWPFWFVFWTLISLASFILCPVVWAISEILAAPIRLSLVIASFTLDLLVYCYNIFKQLLSSLAAILQIAPAARSAEASNGSAILSSLLKDLFYQVFRAVRSILYGVVAFFSTCNRHRYSISKNVNELFRRLSNTVGRHARCSEATADGIEFVADGHRREGSSARKHVKSV